MEKDDSNDIAYPVTTSVSRAEVEEIEEMVAENQKMIAENNKLLKKLIRSNAWAFWLRLVWVAILLGLPFLLYYYILAPYYQSLNSAFSYFGIELPEMPMWGDGE